MSYEDELVPWNAASLRPCRPMLSTGRSVHTATTSAAVLPAVRPTLHTNEFSWRDTERRAVGVSTAPPTVIRLAVDAPIAELLMQRLIASTGKLGSLPLEFRGVTGEKTEGNHTAPGTPSDRATLVALLGDLDGASVSQLTQIAGALGNVIEAQVDSDAGLMIPLFQEEFEARLKVHHATHSKQLDRISLEDAFKAASRRAGRHVGGPEGATAPFIDLVVDGEGVALKSTAAKDVSAGHLHISKLCEAAWIQDVRGAQARETHCKNQILRFLSQAQRIYQLRVLPDRVSWRYQFVEVPVSLFHSILDLDRALFAPDGPRIPVSDASGPCLTLVLDRSDAKITIARIPITRCIVHAQWTLPKKEGDLGREGDN